jgi:hypothetical protein
MQRKAQQQQQAAQQQQQQPGGGGGGGLCNWQIEMPAVITSLNGRHTEFNTARRDFGLTEANRRVLQRTPLKLSEVARMRAQLDESKRFNEQLMAQLNNRAALPAQAANGGGSSCGGGGASLEDPTLSIQITGVNRAVTDANVGNLTSQLLEDKLQSDKLRDRLVYLQGAQNLRIKANNKRRADESAMLSCGQQQQNQMQTLPAVVPSRV